VVNVKHNSKEMKEKEKDKKGGVKTMELTKSPKARKLKEKAKDVVTAASLRPSATPSKDKDKDKINKSKSPKGGN